ncbi:hypothetical protein [Pseudaestuariivita rosea]|uniref:hypothetical protein n=1 Tax=Pseudaestuariivita rosea TaxID=2763263 RepID=UPI001ABA08C7|nr:hypothetical protein [Pseudaestuariivita rosea]
MKLEVAPDRSFWAFTQQSGVGVTILLSSGLIQTTKGIWYGAFADEPSAHVSMTCSARLLDKSIYWLLLHETHHQLLGHFRFSDSFGVAQRLSFKQNSIAQLPSKHQFYVGQCLEMQADHEATEVFLGAFSCHSHEELRRRVMAISGMMMLIEREDAKNSCKGRTHPKAATRIFQLLGHVAELPLIQTQLNGDPTHLPHDERLKAFAQNVTIPCFFDAIHLAQATGAETIEHDLGKPEDFFKDLEIAKIGDVSRHDELKTQGAREWAKLWPCNEALKPILGGHFTN